MERKPEDDAVKEILAGLRSCRPAGQPAEDAPLEQKVASATHIIFDPQEKKDTALVGESNLEGENEAEKFEKMIEDIFHERQEKYLAEQQELIDAYKKEGKNIDAESHQRLLDDQKALGEVLADSGRTYMIEYVKSNLGAYADEKTQNDQARKLVGEFRGKMETFRSIINHQLGNENGLISLLESKGIKKEEVNNTDLRNLFYRLQDIRKIEGTKILDSLLRNFPEKIEAYLRFGGKIENYMETEDYAFLLESASPRLSEFAFGEYKKIAVDTPEREKERMIDVLITPMIVNFFLSFKYWEKEKFEKMISSILDEKTLGQISSEEEKEVKRLLEEKYISETGFAEELLEKEGENGLLKKVGVNYEIADPERFKALVYEFAKDEAEKTIKQVIAERKPETGFVLEQNQQGIVEKVAGNLKKFYFGLLEESKQWEGFEGADEDRVQRVEIDTRAAVRNICNELLVVLQIAEEQRDAARTFIQKEIQKIVFNKEEK